MNSKTFFIAEAGVNHNGSIEKALEMIEVAKASGADAVKFQSFNSAKMITATAKKAEYQKDQTGDGTQIEMLRKLQLDKDAHRVLKDRCDQIGIEFMSSPFDIESADLLRDLGVKRLKLASGELTNVPLIRHLCTFNIPIILSTGMATLDEIKTAVRFFNRDTDLTVLHCNSAYPTPFQDVNLLAMGQIRNEINLPVGYSDHTMGFSACLAATALGATVLEKHFTLDRTLPGPDHHCSLEPHDLRSLVTMVREVEACVSGDGIKTPTASERVNINVIRKSIVATRVIHQGEILTESSITTKRPGTGLSPFMWDVVIGTSAKRDFKPDEAIEL